MYEYTKFNFNPFSSFGEMVKNVSASQWYLAFISNTVSNEKPNKTVSASFQLSLFYWGLLKRTVPRYFKFIYRQSLKIMKTDRNSLLLTSVFSSEHSIEITPYHSTTDFWVNGIGHVVTWFRHKWTWLEANSFFNYYSKLKRERRFDTLRIICIICV